MNIINELLTTLPEGVVEEVQVGPFWTAVVVSVAGGRRCGLASTLPDENHHHGGRSAVQNAGRLIGRSVWELAKLAGSDQPLEATIGMATINATLPAQTEWWVDLNAEAVLAQYGAGKQVALVGHFPFVPRLRAQVGTLWVLEQRPRGDDLPADAADYVIPRADLVAMTGTTLINHTFEGLIRLCRPDALVLVIGPSTPLSPILFDHGVHFLAGSVVEDIDAVVHAVGQGSGFRQVRRQGVRLVTMQSGKG